MTRKLKLYESGCDDEPTESFSGHDDQEFPCTGTGLGWHNVKMENMAATGHKVLLYSDGGCLNPIGEVFTDDSCYAAPGNVSDQNQNLLSLFRELTEIKDGDNRVRYFTRIRARNYPRRPSCTVGTSYQSSCSWIVSLGGYTNRLQTQSRVPI